MSNWSSRTELEQQVLQLRHRGRSGRQIARALGVSRGLVARIVEAHMSEASAGFTVVPAAAPGAAPRPSQLDAHQDRIRELLATYPTITARRILEELRAGGYAGGYSVLKERVRSLRPPKPPEPSRERPVFGPGGMGEQDWSPHRIDFSSSGASTVRACLLVLSHSRRRYLDFFGAEDQYALFEGHRRAFEYWGGVPARIRYDWQKAVVARREGPDIIYQPRLLAFATHYKFEPCAVRPRAPNDKAFVERGLWDVERSFLCGRRFRDLEDLRTQALRWLAEVVDVRHHPRRRQRVIDVFEAEERPALKPLPQHPFDTARLVYRLCSIEGFIHWDGNRYSVPYEHVTALLPVRITQTELFVYGPELTCIARHPLLAKGGGQDSVVEGHRPPRSETNGASLELIRDRFLALGDPAEEFLRGLLETHPRSPGLHARRILELRDRYAAPDVVAAMAHAATFRAFSYHAVARIVAVRARPRTLDEYVAAETESKLRGLLDDAKVPVRDLRHYDLAPPPPSADVASEPLPDAPAETPQDPTADDSGQEQL